MDRKPGVWSYECGNGRRSNSTKNECDQFLGTPGRLPSDSHEMSDVQSTKVSRGTPHQKLVGRPKSQLRRPQKQDHRTKKLS